MGPKRKENDKRKKKKKVDKRRWGKLKEGRESHLLLVSSHGDPSSSPCF